MVIETYAEKPEMENKKDCRLNDEIYTTYRKKVLNKQKYYLKFKFNIKLLQVKVLKSFIIYFNVDHIELNNQTLTNKKYCILFGTCIAFIINNFG